MGYTTIFHIDNDDDIFFFAAAIEHISASANCFSFTNAAKAMLEFVAESWHRILKIRMPEPAGNYKK
ncbi:hypothetical protein B0A67_09140 [Flavobacterium aquidurense]|uniref:hypothetical protein n=1 Tax=Flavobacterium aquidurense TaxID=362413 RepID=UPI00090EE6D5|nr:hypothetical protein [Flavobacterium aquidurense]OXA71984.1 hypothetical protein B0A67_09140 [Flavobacterium aquidurense]SHH63933.1 hypothetical protein SAMN05444481_12184 [Flavobacterium frigidimaris]